MEHQFKPGIHSRQSPTLERLIEIAARHGVRPAGE
jgi:hypothetical protein